MMYRLRLNNRISLLLLGMGLILSTGCRKDKSDDSEENQSWGRTLDYTEEVQFLDQDDEVVTTIEAAVADDDAERSAGLMDVNELPPGHGMLFIFEDEAPRSFWMANTPLSLDIMFVNADMEIIRIHQNTQPFTQNNFESGDPAKYVVETNAGFCVSHDIREGMKIKF